MTTLFIIFSLIKCPRYKIYFFSTLIKTILQGESKIYKKICISSRTNFLSPDSYYSISCFQKKENINKINIVVKPINENLLYSQIHITIMWQQLL